MLVSGPRLRHFCAAQSVVSFRHLLPFTLLLTPLGAQENERAFEAGIDITLEAGAGVSGGADTGQHAQALTIAHAAWHGAAAKAGTFSFFASVLNHAGDGPTERFLGDFLAASNIEAYSSTRLYAWWLEIAHDDWSLRAGALLADEEFAGTDAGGQFCNSIFGWPAFISANTVNTGPAFFVAAPGVRLEHSLSPAVTARVGLYDGDTFDSPTGDPTVNPHGWHYRLGGDEGWFAIAELAFAPPASRNRWKLGIWHHTARFADVYADASGQPVVVTGGAPREYSGDTGAYVAFERVLRGERDQPGFTDFFARAGAAPADRNTLAWALDTGIAWTGLLAGRPQDVLALGFAHAEFSSGFAATARLLDPAAPRADFEETIEVCYDVALSDHLTCKPDMQWIRHPGGSRAQRDALLVMLRFVADF
ncbi:MAG TPA: carbohydrate porin [Opitutus sp.]|nr:carbohydrate porin [Opitutus sp.]